MALTTEQINRLNSSFAFFKPRLGLVADIFEQSLVEQSLPLISHLPMDRVNFELNMLLICGHIADIDLLDDRFAEMGEELIELGVGVDQYPFARDAMLRAFASVSGYTWTKRLHDDWAQAFDLVAAAAFNTKTAYIRAA